MKQETWISQTDRASWAVFKCCTAVRGTTSCYVSVDVFSTDALLYTKIRKMTFETASSR